MRERGELSAAVLGVDLDSVVCIKHGRRLVAYLLRNKKKIREKARGLVLTELAFDGWGRGRWEVTRRMPRRKALRCLVTASEALCFGQDQVVDNVANLRWETEEVHAVLTRCNELDADGVAVWGGRKK
jgi:hypothetical protein